MEIRDIICLILSPPVHGVVSQSLVGKEGWHPRQETHEAAGAVPAFITVNCCGSTFDTAPSQKDCGETGMEASKNPFGVVKQALPASDGLASLALRVWTARLNRLIGFGPISLHIFSYSDQ